VRNPLLDFRIVEFALGLPDKFKMQGKTLKYLLKKAYEKDFPPGFLQKPKQGFAIPAGEFLKKEFKQQMNSMLANGSALDSMNVFNMDYLRTLFISHCSGKYHTFQLWPMYVFGKWLENSRK
jgi:asparagine synthase (glutamine-hydrolysing)